MPPDNRVVRQRLANGNVIEGIIYGGKETGGCRGRCEYTERRPGLFNNIKFKGNCKPVGDGCKCGALECSSGSGRYASPSTRPSDTLFNRRYERQTFTKIKGINRNIYNL